ncbi:hypothetical protein ACJMK2_024303 [Sinanodonta woodiana]|uniref:Uncharacterized protein n=1 Tax=Sinanodonta woodiana TaxID=1069815 RepID=A0ABD3T7W8_SINWO
MSTRDKKDKKITDDFLKCELCKRILQDPRTLQCMHSFCRDCLLTYIVETTKSSSKGSFQCPLCLQTIMAPISGQPPEKWADHLDVDPFLNSYIEVLTLKDMGKLCDTCERQEKNSVAEKFCRSCHDALCDECVGFHNALKTTKAHIIEDLSKLRRQPIREIIEEPNCKDHDGEHMIRYCETHKELVCEKCVATKHKNCKDVITTSEAAQKRKHEATTMLDSLTEETQMAKSIYEDRMAEDSALEETQERILKQIQTVRQNVNEILTKLEGQSIRQLYDVHKKEKANIQTELKEAQRTRKAVGKVQSSMEYVTKHGSDGHIMQVMEKAKNQERIYNDRVINLNNKIQKTRLEFIVDSTLQKVMSSVKELGELKIINIKGNLPLSSTIQSSRSTLAEDHHEASVKSDNKSGSSGEQKLVESVATFSGRTPSDWEPCWFTGVVYLPNDQILLVDRNNSKVKIFDKDLQPISETTLLSQPFDAALVSMSEIALTIPRENKIELYTIGTNLTHKGTILTSDRCYGISFARDRFAVTCACGSPPSVKVYSKEGKEMLDICPEENYQPLFFRPWYVHLEQSGNSFIVSDCNRSHVTSVTGSVIKRYVYKSASLSSPRGFCVMSDGKILVCGWGSDNIQLIDENGHYIQDVISRKDGIIGPQNVAVNSKGDKLVVTFDPSSGSSDSVKLYRYKSPTSTKFA